MTITRTRTSRQHAVTAFVADLELEVDRLRKQTHFIQQKAADAVQRIQRLCEAGRQKQGDCELMTQIETTIEDLGEVLSDLQSPVPLPAEHDEVVSIEVRPLVEQIFRWQQRLQNSPFSVLHLELNEERIAWFPLRLRHILENLISNSLRYRDTSKGEIRISLSLAVTPKEYEFRLTDNGVGLPLDPSDSGSEPFDHSSPNRSAGLGVGLAVVEILVQQVGGIMDTRSWKGLGTSIVVALPRFEMGDFVA